MRVKFNADAVYPQNNPADSREYKAGETYDLNDDHASRWIRRGVAVEVVPEPTKKPAAEPAKVEGQADADAEVMTPKQAQYSKHRK